MVVLRTPGSVANRRDLILATDITNLVGAILGTPAFGQTIALVDKDDATNYANVFGNKDLTNGRAVKIQYGDHAGSPVTLATFAKAAISLELSASIKQLASQANPASGYTNIGARSSDGRPVFRSSGGSETLLGLSTEAPSGILTTTGDIIISTSGSTAGRLGIGTTNYTLAVVGGLPSWQPSVTSVLTTQGDLPYASSANTLARLAKGTAFQELTMNSGATAPQWSSGALALAAAAGDTFHATAVNALGKLPKGSDGQVYTLASGLPTWATPVSATTTLLKLSETIIADDVTGSVTYSSIPGTYRHILVTVNGRSFKGTNDVMYIRFNGDTGANYDYERFQAQFTTASALETYAATLGEFGLFPGTGDTSTSIGCAQIMVHNYALATMYKSYISDWFMKVGVSTGGLLSAQTSGGWRSTAAITSITVGGSTANFKSGTVVSFYGIP